MGVLRTDEMDITLTQILDDLRTADEIVRRFERRYWLSSADFYDLFQQGLLDDGDRTEDYALWAGFHLINLDRQAALASLSRERVRQLRSKNMLIDPREPVLHADNGIGFPSREDYDTLINELPGRNPEIARSSLRLRTASAPTVIVDGELNFANGLRLRVIEAIDFKVGRIQSYAYTVWRGNDKLGWFDPAPPGPEPGLSDTYPHHYHDLTSGAEQRRPANGLSFVQPNLPALVNHCLALATPASGGAGPATGPQTPAAA
jgi:hypothetical protein